MQAISIRMDLDVDDDSDDCGLLLTSAPHVATAYYHKAVFFVENVYFKLTTYHCLHCVGANFGAHTLAVARARWGMRVAFSLHPHSG